MMSNTEQLTNQLSGDKSFKIAKKHRRTLEESSHKSETKGEKELRKKKEKEKTKTEEDLAATPNNVNHSETDEDGLEREEILKKKGKKRHAEHEFQAGSNSEKQHKKARLDALLASNINSKNKKKRKHKSCSGVSETVLQKTKHRSQSKELRDEENCHQRHQGEDGISCFEGTDNKHVCLELSTLPEKSGGGISFSVDVLEAKERRRRKKKKKKQKEKERNKTVQVLAPMNVNDDNILEGNVENKKKRKKSSIDISEIIVSQNGKHESQTREHREKEKCSQQQQDEDGISREQDTENVLGLGPSTLERPDDENSFLQVDNSLESRTTKEEELKKKRKKKNYEKEEGKEKNKTGRDVTVMETIDVRNDEVLDGNEDIGSEVETTFKNRKKQQYHEKLSEAIVHSNTIHETYTVSKERLKELREKGIKVKTGKWSLQELELLQSNMDAFLETHELSNPMKILFHTNTDKEESRFWKRYARTNGFYKELGKGILRPLNAIYKCTQRFYDSSNYIGKYSDEEVKELRRLQAIHGGDWVTIGQLLGRSRMSVNRKYSKLPTRKGKKGRWTDDELKHLKEAVYVVTNTAEDQPAPFHGICWKAVAQIVKTRSNDQCRKKWLERLCWMEDKNEKQWTKQNELKLITRLYNSGITEDCDVDWIELKSEFKTNYPPQWLRKKWLEIKRKAPNYHQLDFEDTVDYLYNVYCKTLRSQVGDETSNNETS